MIMTLNEKTVQKRRVKQQMTSNITWLQEATRNLKLRRG